MLGAGETAKRLEECPEIAERRVERGARSSKLLRIDGVRRANEAREVAIEVFHLFGDVYEGRRVFLSARAHEPAAQLDVARAFVRLRELFEQASRRMEIAHAELRLRARADLAHGVLGDVFFAEALENVRPRRFEGARSEVVGLEKNAAKAPPRRREPSEEAREERCFERT